MRLVSARATLVIGAFIGSLSGSAAQAGPAYQALKACLQNCINTTPPLTIARALCGADCLADYADSKISLSQGPNIQFSPNSTGYATLAGAPPLANAYLNLIGDPTATISVSVVNGVAPLTIDYILVNDANNPPPPGFGTLLGMSSNSANGYAINFSPSGDGFIVAEAHYTSSPTEDIDQVAGIYYSTGPLAVPEPASCVMAGMGLSVVAGLAWRRRRVTRT